MRRSGKILAIGSTARQQMKTLQFTVGFFAAMIVSPYAHSGIPPYVIPGALEKDVRAALPLVNCRPGPAGSNHVMCDSSMTKLDGISGRFSVTFAFERLMFMSFFIEQKHFDAASQSDRKLLGAPSRTESFEIPMGEGDKALNNTLVWGSEHVLASISLYAPGVDGHAQMFFLHPLAVPADVLATYFPPK